MKINSLYLQCLFLFICAALSVSSAWAQKGETVVVILKAESMINHQLKGLSSDPVEAVHQLAKNIIDDIGGQVEHEFVGESSGFIVSGLDGWARSKLLADINVYDVLDVDGANQAQRASLSVSVSCSYTGLGDLYECVANVSGGSPAYSYDWEAANHNMTSFGNVGWVRSCVIGFHESFIVRVTDSSGTIASRTGSVSCIGGGF